MSKNVLSICILVFLVASSPTLAAQAQKPDISRLA